MKPKIDPAFSEWLVKERLKNSLAKRFLLRFHASLMLAVAVAAGWATNRALFGAGIELMLVRHVISVLAAYGAFLAALQVWIEVSGIRTYVDAARSGDLLGGPAPEKKDSTVAGDIASGLDLGDGCAPMLVFLLFLGVLYAMGGYLVVHATGLFADVVFELLLAAGLLPGIRKLDRLGTEGRLPLVTLWALAAALLAVVLFNGWAQHNHPGAKTVSEALMIKSR